MTGWAVATWLLAVSSGPSPAAAEISALRARIAREEVRNRFLVDERRSLRALIAETDRAIADRLARAEALDRQRRQAEAAREEAEAALAETRAELLALQRTAGRRAAAMRRLTRLGPEAYWLSMEDPTRSRRTEDRLRFVVAHDARLARAIEELIERRDERVLRVQGRVEALAVARARLQDEASELSRLQAERAVLNDALGHEQERSDEIRALLDDASRSSARASVGIRGGGAPPPARPGGFAAQRGRLPWPVQGRVEVTFGAKVHPAGVIVRQTGLDIRAPRGATVHAVHDGQVVWADRLPGYGRVVIVRHERVAFTVYAHLDTFAVERDQMVRRSDTVGTVGSSGSRKGAYLYFEVRSGAQAVDPLGWLD